LTYNFFLDIFWRTRFYFSLSLFHLWSFYQSSVFQLAHHIRTQEVHEAKPNGILGQQTDIFTVRQTPRACGLANGLACACLLNKCLEDTKILMSTYLYSVCCLSWRAYARAYAKLHVRTVKWCSDQLWIDFWKQFKASSDLKDKLSLTSPSNTLSVDGYLIHSLGFEIRFQHSIFRSPFNYRYNLRVNWILISTRNFITIQ